ncbi:MAG: polyprenyl synthetase family protein [Gammaproteobacteria bacterium]|nr:polyprenyl synthetase family protein [Gammaproteobacteria bacterium]
MSNVVHLNTSKGRSSRSFAEIRALVAEDFQSVDSLISGLLRSKVSTISDIGQHIVEGGGKRLRPLIVLLTVKGCNYQGEDHIRLATLIEFLHTATLLHDDVVDESDRRRGRATANAIWGNKPSVLVGDFLYSRAFQLMVEINRMDLMSIISDATNTIAEGEVMQLENIGNVHLSETDYMEIIRCKSALLFEAAAETAAVLSNSTPALMKSLKSFGLNLGLAYQIIDDILDYIGDSDILGKNVGDDLSEGKLTLPLIYAMQHGGVADASRIKTAIENRDPSDLANIIETVKATGALERAKQKARMLSNAAIDALRHDPPIGTYRNALIQLTQSALERIH